MITQGSWQKTCQIFITGQCNRRCDGCFMANYLGHGHMRYNDFQDHVLRLKDAGTEKITIIGGEPTVHPQFTSMIDFTMAHVTNVTVYSNGLNTHKLRYARLYGAKIRIGVHGFSGSEKPITGVHDDLIQCATIVYMLDSKNIAWLMPAMQYAEDRGCRDFYISSMLDMRHGFWNQKNPELSHFDYRLVVNKAAHGYCGDMRLHVASRGVFPCADKRRCRFWNIMPDGTEIRCPLDIQQQITVRDGAKPFSECACNKATACLMQKIVIHPDYLRQVL